MKRIITWLFVITGLVSLNHFMLGRLLRINGFYQKNYESQLDKELKNADHIFDFSPNLKDRLIDLGLESKFKLNYHGKDKRISYSSVESYNPYPPILHLFDTAYVIYNNNFKLKQITILSGECDATPSILVEKARGTSTGFGDHFVTYIFYSNEMSGKGADYYEIDWYSWRGGSYNGFEELLIFPITLIEIIIIITFLRLRRRRKKHPNHSDFIK